MIESYFCISVLGFFPPVSRFVKHTGYGNAAGLLASRGLLGGQGLRTPSPDGQYSSDSDSDTEEYRKVKDRINPVTGRVESPQPDPMEGMTEEEKEEEARRLLMLFNKAAKSVERLFALSAQLHRVMTEFYKRFYFCFAETI